MTKTFLCLIMLLPAAAQEVEVATEVAALEGPTVDREGNVYFSNMVAQRIMKLSKDGVLSTYRENTDTNGLLIDPQGRLIACERGKNPRITRTDLRTGKMEILADNYQGMHFESPNDVTIDARAGFTSQIRLRPPYIASIPQESSRASLRSPIFSAPMEFRSHPTTRHCIWSNLTEPKAAHA